MIDSLERAVGRPVSRETIDRLHAYAGRLTAESSRQNLISTKSLDSLWQRHILDSAQLVRFVARGDASWIDIGSGAGLPGIVVACLVDGPVTLVEPRRLRAAFLRETVTALELNANIHQASADKVHGTFDVITGRAVAALPKFLEMCDHLSTRNTQWVLPKGQSAKSELEDARRSWQGLFHVEQSLTDPDAKIVVGTAIEAKKR